MQFQANPRRLKDAVFQTVQLSQSHPYRIARTTHWVPVNFNLPKCRACSNSFTATTLMDTIGYTHLHAQSWSSIEGWLASFEFSAARMQVFSSTDKLALCWFGKVRCCRQWLALHSRRCDPHKLAWGQARQVVNSLNKINGHMAISNASLIGMSEEAGATLFFFSNMMG